MGFGPILALHYQIGLDLDSPNPLRNLQDSGLTIMALLVLVGLGAGHIYRRQSAIPIGMAGP